MACPADVKPPIHPSPLQLLVTDASLLSPSHLPSLQTLAIQIQHNLQYQHSWTALRLHTHSPLTNEPLPRPLISGLPPKRLYVHPDEQIELLKKAEQDRQVRSRQGDNNTALDIKTELEPEWVLPTRLDEKWTAHRLSDVFGAITVVPPDEEASDTSEDRPANPWRTVKRIVLAAVSTDSTVVYYIVQDGVVKPRQN
ncbi:hypothetical protein CC78DRAFT_534419 [Lojkania enalia]|uniref:tRNA-splicing endonuclease subunit Sen15 domain-containing protein n=1 Tax=Lojkania enalia TaxID=147567 RepID=A0A9P4N2R8_9PLEO|nr:hypothetical protein CC78DRAFT_534419 [Didymosphaeria enalia]